MTTTRVNFGAGAVEPVAAVALAVGFEPLGFGDLLLLQPATASVRTTATGTTLHLSRP